MRKTFYIILFLLILGLVAWINLDKVQTPGKPPYDNTPGLKTVDINFEFDNDDVVDIKYSYSNSDDLFTITQKISAQENWDFGFEDYGDMGILVTSISDKENGQDQKYWQFFVAGQQPLLSADKYYPPQGTTIDWKFQTSEF
ncbi:DUF4430 domain-containing protein [Candidatus Parcubacteria bacterium]|jgi:hypothetical protein|nr:DUF4430 domain-containing protein [Candidatus Parcubacteria bacterium]